MKEFIKEIFSDIAEKAMDRGHSVSLRYECDKGESKTFISSSNRDEDVLSLSTYPVKDEEDKDETTVYVDGLPAYKIINNDEEEDDDEE